MEHAATTDDQPTNLDHALAYARRGWRVVPVPSGRKVPAVTAWQREGTTDEARIAHWWTQAPDHGIGIVCGAASGLWVLDVDVADGKTGDDTLGELTDAYGPLPDTFEVITGSGGRHIYFAWPEDQEIRNNASGRLGPGLDVRGEGGFVVAPPSLHASGRRYEPEATSPTHLAQAPGWLLEMLKDPEPAPGRTPAPDAGDRPGDRWAASVTWDELLAADGWTKLRPGAEGEDRWTRPGKDQREGPSATVGYRGSDVLKVFTSSHPQLRADDTYTKLGYLAATRFGGDHAAAASWCRSQGHGSDSGSVLDLLPPEAKAPQPWPEPKPWPTLTPLPPFPLHTLPTWAAEHAVAAADARQVPVDLCATLAIGSLAAAATGRARVHLNAEWHEPVALYLVCAMRSGAGKSPAEKAMVGWLRRWERSRIEMVNRANEEAEVAAMLARKAVEKLGRNEGATIDEILSANARLKEAEAALIPTPRLIIDDATPEAVATMLAAYGERLAILSTEADLFDSLLRGNANQRPNLNVYLKAWSGDEMRRDRKGGSETGPESTILTNPLLTVSVTVQPSVLARLLTDAEMVGRGFAARFMVSAPTDLMGHRDQRRRFAAPGVATAAAYEAAAAALADRWATWARPADLHLSPDAARRLEDYLVELEPELAIGAELEHLAEWAAKLTASVARYAGLLHLCEGDPSAPIGGDTMARAVDLGRYWLAHAVGIARSGEDRTTRQARALLDWLEQWAGTEVAITDMQKGCRHPGDDLRLDKVADYVPAVELLVDHGWLRPVDKGDWRRRVGVRGQKSASFAISPFVHEPAPSGEVSRHQKFASMGERDLSSSPFTPPTPGIHAMRDTRDSPPSDDAPVDNSTPPPPPDLGPVGLDEILGLDDDEVAP